MCIRMGILAKTFHMPLGQVYQKLPVLAQVLPNVLFESDRVFTKVLL